MSEERICTNCLHASLDSSKEPCTTCETCNNYNCHEEGCSLFPDQCVWVPVQKSESFTPALDDLKKAIVLTPKYEIKAKELADEHWSYVKDVLTTHCSPEAKAFIGEIGFHYKTAFVHGYKHGKEDS